MPPQPKPHDRLRVAADWATIYSGATYLQDHNLVVWLDGEHPIAHDKVLTLETQTRRRFHFSDSSCEPVNGETGKSGQPPTSASRLMT